ncbi:MAG TPA: right-handed parallel beta-helix repeat-containing protein [Verrucomicrobiota bacterium]|nr:right-handed parallel beta-helix repeat-containing protein [Verrucomicrobiota bacterium]
MKSVRSNQNSNQRNSILTAVAMVTLMSVSVLDAATYWVAPNGNDSNAGTSNAPFATPHKAVTATLAPGDTIYIRGGNYSFNSRIAPGSSKVGAAGNHIKFWAYPGELPVFDFASMPESSDKALDMRRNYWHVKGIEIKNAPDSGIFVGGTGVIIEGCVVHDCDNDGIVLGSTSSRATNALILNCDSYRNYQAGSGGNNGDGFSAKSGCGPGNVFRGCRAWYNADDGWDFYDNITNSVVIENCWAFNNGTNLWGVGSWQGNGNGFKLGGAGTRAPHTVRNSVAFDNHSKGFDHNNGVGAHVIHNNTGFRNGKWNFSFYDQPISGVHDFRNNVSYLGGGINGTNIVQSSVMVSNSWQHFTVTPADFQSLDASLAFAPRNADYSLPTNAFARLAAGSQFIDQGIDVGLPFNGPRPDLGAYEFSAAAPVQTPSWFDTAGCGITNGGFRVSVAGLTGHGSVVIYASSNLLDWTPIFTNPPVTGSLTYLDTSAGNGPGRLYRVEEN